MADFCWATLCRNTPNQTEMQTSCGTRNLWILITSKWINAIENVGHIREAHLILNIYYQKHLYRLCEVETAERMLIKLLFVYDLLDSGEIIIYTFYCIIYCIFCQHRCSNDFCLRILT